MSNKYKRYSHEFLLKFAIENGVAVFIKKQNIYIVDSCGKFIDLNEYKK